MSEPPAHLAHLPHLAPLPHFAGRRVDHGPFRPVTALIEEQTDRTPHRPAVTCHDGTDEVTLTYAEFDALANGLAAELAAAGVAEGDTVPVVIGNSAELPLSMVALLKLGAAFVPCDPAWPEERLATVFRVLDPPLALTAAPLFRSCPSGHLVDRHAVTPRRERPTVPLRPGLPAYGVFTSGSSGTPKCALNLHRGLTNRFRFMSRYFAATGDEVVLQNSRHTFDSAIWQLLWPLTTGGRTVVPEQGEFLDLERTVDTIARHRVTVTDFVPAILAMLVALLESSPATVPRIASLRHLVVGGEEIIPRAVHRLRELVPGLTVTNGYGPSETAIGMVFHRVDAADGDQIPLGRPIDNCYTVVAEPGSLRPLPPDTTGEILIGGACVGAGYLGDPDRTAAAFLPNPYGPIPGEVLYRTGDLGRLDADGLLRFDGRSDRQAQVDGVRVELAEIETTAESCPGVVQAKAMTLPHGDRTRLVLTAAADDTGLTPASLRSRLRAALPRVQVPHHCFVLPSLPLTDTGKVDLQTLRAYVEEKLAAESPPSALSSASAPASSSASARESSRETSRPRGAADARAAITHALRTALGVPELGPHDDFFAHGADSLTALDAVIRLRKTAGLTVLLSDLYEHRTPAALAVVVATPRADRAHFPADGECPATDADLPLMHEDAQLPADVAQVLRNLPRPRPSSIPGLRARPRDHGGEAGEAPVPTSEDGISARALNGRAADGCSQGKARRDVGDQGSPEALTGDALARSSTGEAPRRGKEGARGTPQPQAPAPTGPAPAGPAPSVLVTGATGFIGTRTVHTLLRTTRARLVCLVRARDTEQAAARLQHALESQGLWDPAHAPRLTVRCGDLGSPRFGLPQPEWDELAAECDAVLHIGALVNFLLDYRAHRPANVLGTTEALRFALTHRVKPLHHVSTLGVLDRHAATTLRPLGEDCDPALVTPPASGYSRSKWVAERLLSTAARAGAPVTLYRLGEVMPAADNGVPNPKSLTHLLLSAFHRLGLRPDVPIRSDWTPVDAVAARLAAGLTEPATGAAYHVFDGHSVDFTELDLAAEDTQRHVPPAEFMAALRTLAENENENEDGNENEAADGDKAADVDKAERERERDSGPALLYALLRSLPSRPGAAHPDFRRLLVDNPALFTRDACTALDARHGLADQSLAPSVAAYRSTLDGAARAAPVTLRFP